MPEYNQSTAGLVTGYSHNADSYAHCTALCFS